jgi:nuclease-like protein
VRQVLAPLRAEGWRLRHAVSWDGRGDIDHVAITPHTVGLAFVIETKTRTYAAHQLARPAARAQWVVSRRRRWCPRGAVPVLRVMRPCGIQRSENGVLVLSIDRLTAALRDNARAWTRPALRAPGRQTKTRKTVESSPDRGRQVAVARSIISTLSFAPVPQPSNCSFVVNKRNSALGSVASPNCCK